MCQAISDGIFPQESARCIDVVTYRDEVRRIEEAHRVSAHATGALFVWHGSEDAELEQASPTVHVYRFRAVCMQIYHNLVLSATVWLHCSPMPASLSCYV